MLPSLTRREGLISNEKLEVDERKLEKDAFRRPTPSPVLLLLLLAVVLGLLLVV
jgi:hypothetical protein